MGALMPAFIGHTVAGLSGAPNGGKKIPAMGFWVSPEDSGAYRVNGVVEIFGAPNTPVQRAVRLIDWKSGRIVREVFSNATTGAYSFDGVKSGPWLVLTHDPTGEYNAVVADNIYGTLM